MVAGEALIDLVISESGAVEASLGGAPFNTSRAVARLGGEVSFVGAISTDRFGSMLVAQLAADGVSVAGVRRVEAPTTLAVAEVDATGAAMYRFYIAGTSAPLLELPIGGRLGEYDIVFTGGLGLVVEPMAETIERFVATSTDAVVMVDVNCRPQVVPDRARYLARLERVLAATHVVKVSDDDLAYLEPDRDARDAARALLGRGPRVVLLTAGAAGVRVLTASDEEVVPAFAVDVVDTVGAGDTFAAGFLVAWAEGDDLHRLDGLGDIDRLVAAARFGARAASVACTRRGADPPHRHDL